MPANMMNKFLAYVFFLILGAWGTCALILASPSDPKNAILFGYSLERILLASGLILLTLPLLYLTLKLIRQPQQFQHLPNFLIQNKKILFASILFSFGFLILFLLPSYRLGDFASYISRLYPTLIWLTVVSVVTMFLLITAQKTESLWSIVCENKTILLIAFYAVAIFILIILLISLTGIGIRQSEDYWFGAGVPVLGLQVLFSLLCGALIAWLQSNQKIKNNFRFDWLVGLGLFTLTAFLWAREPVLPNYFMPDTAKNVMYPYSDSFVFDMASQYALIGEGLFSGRYFDRALYSSFLTLLHAVFGQNFEKILMVQAILYSVFPVVIYFIGKELHSRAFGFALGVLISLRGINAILAATWIDLAGPKLMTTDFPTMIGIALFMLFAILWIKNLQKLSYLALAGGILGLTLMLRTHVLFLALAFVFCIIMIVGWKRNWNFRGFAALTFILGMLSATTPWDLRNLQNGTPMFYLYYSRIQLIFSERYNFDIDASIPNDEDLVEAIPSNSKSSHQRVLQVTESGCRGVPCKITNHFFHNVIASFLILPSSFVFDGLWNTVKEGAPYWQIAWKGAGITFTQWVLIAVNLILVSLGIGVAWSKHKWLGLLPLFVFVIYMASNALALTSAGRYVAPADWIVCLYYLLGAFQCVLWLMQWVKWMPTLEDQVEIKNEAREFSSIRFNDAIPALILIFGIGSLIPLAELPFEKRYEIKPPQQIFSQLQESGLLERSGFSENELSEFLSQPNAMMFEGRALYPRYYTEGKGEPDRSSHYRYLDFSRLVFTVIGPYADFGQGVVIAGDKPNFEIHAEDVIVLGCWNTNYYAPFLDAAVVFVLNDEGYVYLREPAVELRCPIPEP